MQLYVADYLGDTRHLTTEQHGAYLLLLMAMWRADGVLPADDGKLARMAGLTVARWRKISEDVLAFFTPCDGGITQARLAAELTIANEKSQKRSQSGKAGARAKALKNNKQPQANADRSLKHSPEPEPEEETPTPFSLAPLANLIGLSASGSFDDIAEAAYLAQPAPGKKRRSCRPDVRDGLAAAIKRGASPADLLRALRAYYALPESRKDGGQYASGAKVILAKDRWRDFLPRPQAQPPPTAIDPAYRAHLERHFLTTGEWRPEWGEKPAKAA